MQTITRKYGWRHDLPDHRDIPFTASAAPLPPAVDLRAEMPPVYDQGELGSCTANAIAAAFDYERAKQGLVFMSPSRLFIYANERIMERTPLSEDSGAQIRDGVKSLHKRGVCPEACWPYNIAQFSVKPPAEAYADALKDLALQYHTVGLGGILACLAARRPVIIGISVYESFESHAVAQTGIVPLPAEAEQCLGGHAVLIVGYNLAARTYLVRNSWGQGWGNSGYFTLPFEYLEKYGSDFWTLVKVE